MNNIEITKMNNPDYLGRDPVESTNDFLGRIRNYE